MVAVFWGLALVTTTVVVAEATEAGTMVEVSIPVVTILFEFLLV